MSIPPSSALGGTRLPSELPAPWGGHLLPEGEPISVRLGPGVLWMRCGDGEIWLAHEEVGPDAELEGPGEGPRERPPPEELGWGRWATPSGEREIVLRPIFPDRAVVLEPERPFRLLPRAEARIFVRVPLWIRVELVLGPGSEENLVLTEIPAAPLSDTWWGGFMEGELAYWLPTTARRRMTEDLFAPYLGVCPLSMTNRATTHLTVEKLALRVAHLSLFAHDGHLWADESIVTYQGEGDGSEIHMTGHPPDDAGGGVLVSAPRSPMPRGFRARTFHRLLALPGMGAA